MGQSQCFSGGVIASVFFECLSYDLTLIIFPWHDLVIEMAKVSLGVGCVIKDFVKEELQNGTLLEIPLGIPIHKREIGFAYNRDIKVSDSLEKFIHFYESFR